MLCSISRSLVARALWCASWTALIVVTVLVLGRPSSAQASFLNWGRVDAEIADVHVALAPPPATAAIFSWVPQPVEYGLTDVAHAYRDVPTDPFNARNVPSGIVWFDSTIDDVLYTGSIIVWARGHWPTGGPAPAVRVAVLDFTAGTSTQLTGTSGGPDSVISSGTTIFDATNGLATTKYFDEYRFTFPPDQLLRKGHAIRLIAEVSVPSPGFVTFDRFSHGTRSSE